ncbi:protein L [Stenotrophomonas maltophilia]|uniref:protein L n=1 Tax=Stenotrophomonas maltophilia TaxID=40324 RepID=UPI0013DC1FFC|nr:protein L [Stenotrophomonas maltophilia]MBN5031286.1 protein L [Stenotrophomonas maltophilia]
MAWHTSGSVLTAVNPTNTWWNTVYGPGHTVPVSGIYICLGCRREITSNQNDPFPPQSHHQHSTQQGSIRWKLNVRTNTDGA